MTLWKDIIREPYEVKTYVMYYLYECMLNDLVMLRYEIWLCMWITVMASKLVYLVYVGVWKLFVHCTTKFVKGLWGCLHMI